VGVSISSSRPDLGGDRGQGWPLHNIAITNSVWCMAYKGRVGWLALTRYCQYFIFYFYCNKGGRGENILRNIVGNKGGLGGGYWYCTIMCNNAPLFRVENGFFFRHLHPSKIRPLKLT